ncbi:YdcF family protein [Patescibacteria group bacterium]|nr:YdcF family protein [Patescibacteria group bacterium]MBU1721711.1 YdcF family protein [Patescibacteria group bacterium]MBU1901866.1 YdcF family protein [Patescibacteria group bacterium]
MRAWRITKNIIRLLVVNVLFLFLFAVIASNAFILEYKQRIVVKPEPVQTAIVFGAGMVDEAEMSQLQRERVQKGIDLYRAGVVKELLMTGDDGAMRGSEVQAMKKMAVDAGVPADVISVDPHGYNTYASCYRAVHEFNIDQAILVSHEFHLPRILYMCQTFGLPSVGVAAKEGNYTIHTKWWSMEGREMLARLKGWWQVSVTHPEPKMYIK